MNTPTLAHSTEQEANFSSVASQSPAQEANTRRFTNFMESNILLEPCDGQHDNLMNLLPPPPINSNSYRTKQASTDSFISLPVEQHNDYKNKDLSCEYPSAMSSQLSFTHNSFNSANIGYSSGTQNTYPSPYSQHNTFKTIFHSTPDLHHESNLDSMYNGRFDLVNQSFDSINSPNNSYMKFSDNESSDYIRSYSQTSYQSDFAPYSFTPILSDAYTPTFSDTSYFTPNTTVNEDFPNVQIAPPMFDQDKKNIQNPKPLNSTQKARNLNSINGTGTIKKDGSSVMVPYANSIISLSQSSPHLVDNSYHTNHTDLQRNNTSKIITSSTPNQQVFASNKTPDSSSSRTASLNNSNKDSTRNRRTGYPILNEAFAQKALEFSNSKVHKPLQHLQVNGNNKPKKYTRRRLSPRSKNGCWICRIKHLKCDEQKPACSGCLKFGVECDYSEEKPAYVSDKNLRKEKLLSISVIRRRKTKCKGTN